MRPFATTPPRAPVRWRHEGFLDERRRQNKRGRPFILNDGYPPPPSEGHFRPYRLTGEARANRRGRTGPAGRSSAATIAEIHPMDNLDV